MTKIASLYAAQILALKKSQYRRNLGVYVQEDLRCSKQENESDAQAPLNGHLEPPDWVKG